MVESLTRDRRTAGSSLTGVTALCPLARQIKPSLVLVQPRKTRPYITERLYAKNQIIIYNMVCQPVRGDNYSLKRVDYLPYMRTTHCIDSTGKIVCCVMAEMNPMGTNYAHIEHTKLPLVQSVMLNQIWDGITDAALPDLGAVIFP